MPSTTWPGGSPTAGPGKGGEAVDIEFRETSALDRPDEVPLSHLSVEVGHFYAADAEGGVPALTRHFAAVEPWVDPAHLARIARVPRERLRASTCLLIDDYYERMPPPNEVIPAALKAAEAVGVRIDYIAREAACARTDDVALAALVEGLIISDPSLGDNGARPPLNESGWLCNGARSPNSNLGPAMEAPALWQAPVENGARTHSIFLDVQLWSEDGTRRTWACAFLAAVWQLLRLGLIRVAGKAPSEPAPVRLDELPDRWADLPAVATVSERPPPFRAYRTYSVLPSKFLSVEHAVRVILGQVAVNPTVLEQAIVRAGREDLTLAREPSDRISYVLLGG